MEDYGRSEGILVYCIARELEIIVRGQEEGLGFKCGQTFPLLSRRSLRALSYISVS